MEPSGLHHLKATLQRTNDIEPQYGPVESPTHRHGYIRRFITCGQRQANQVYRLSVLFVRTAQRRLLTAQAFSHEIQKNFPSKNDKQAQKNLIDELENRINAIKSYSLKSPGSQRHTQLDSAGTDLWNWCVQARRQDYCDVLTERSKLFTYVRVYAFLILALAQWGDRNTPGDLLRLEKLAIKAGRSCIGILHLCPTIGIVLRNVLTPV